MKIKTECMKWIKKEEKNTGWVNSLGLSHSKHTLNCQCYFETLPWLWSLVPPPQKKKQNKTQYKTKGVQLNRGYRPEKFQISNLSGSQEIIQNFNLNRILSTKGNKFLLPQWSQHSGTPKLVWKSKAEQKLSPTYIKKLVAYKEDDDPVKSEQLHLQFLSTPPPIPQI